MNIKLGELDELLNPAAFESLAAKKIEYESQTSSLSPDVKWTQYYLFIGKLAASGRIGSSEYDELASLAEGGESPPDKSLANLRLLVEILR